MSQLRVGVIGCGEVTQVMHLPSLAFLRDLFQVTALCDVSDQVAQGVADQWRVKGRFHDYRELLGQPDVDVVLIANPDAFHAEATLAAIAAGKHVLIEKPMCLDLAEADRIVAAQAATGVVAQVGYMRRYAPAFVEACRLVAELGDIRLARVHDVLGGNHLFTGRTSRTLRGTDAGAAVAGGQAIRETRIRETVADALGGAKEPPDVLCRAYGLMLGLSSHDLSAMRELLGVPRRVLYAAQRRGGLYLSAAFDYGPYICHFETGIDNLPRFDAYLEVYGNERTVRVQYDTPYVRNLPIRLHVKETDGAGRLTERTELPGWGDAFVAEWEAFHANVLERRTPKTSPADFRCDLELFRTMIQLMA